MVATGEQRAVLRCRAAVARLLSSCRSPGCESVVEEAVEPEVVLEIVFRHAPDEDGESAVDELGQLFLVGFEVPDKIFVVHIVCSLNYYCYLCSKLRKKSRMLRHGASQGNPKGLPCCYF